MKKFSLALIAVAVLGASCNALAADAAVKGASGQIKFTGTINNDACSIDSSDAGNDIAVNMGEVSIKDMGTAENPASGRVTSGNFNLKVNCNKGTKVAMIFDATGAGSGLVTGKNVLALNRGTDSATGVGIALLDNKGQSIDLSSKATARIESDMHGVGTEGGDTTLNFSAAYVTLGDAGTATAGRGDAQLPFILEYQ